MDELTEEEKGGHASRRRVDHEREQRHAHKQAEPHLPKVGCPALVELWTRRERASVSL
jgi:hypothetical protein